MKNERDNKLKSKSYIQCRQCLDLKQQSCSRSAVLWAFVPDMWSTETKCFFSVFSFGSGDRK